MSAEFESKAVILSLINNISCPISSTSRSKPGLGPTSNALHFCSKQRLVLETPSLSMRLRPKRYRLLSHFFDPFRDLLQTETKLISLCFVFMSPGLVLALKCLGVFT
ncbi:unnamed protein product [Brassica rapa subsp. narinosa]